MYSHENKDFLKYVNKLTKESDFFKKVSKVKYRSPKTYLDYDELVFIISRLYTSYVNFYSIEDIQTDFTHKTSLITMNELYHKSFKPLWLKKDLLEAFSKTSFPETLNEFKVVIPIGLIFLPEYIINPDGKAIKWLLFFHRDSNYQYSEVKTNSANIQIQSEDVSKISWITCLEDGSQYSITRNLIIKDSKIDFSTNNLYINENLLMFNKNIETSSEKEFTDKVTSILLQTLLFLQQTNCYQNYVSETEKIIKNKRKTDKVQPYIIGENYQTKKEYNKDSLSIIEFKNVEEARRTLRTHWRKGFYRYQPYGKKEEGKTKLIWIEPVLVNS